MNDLNKYKNWMVDYINCEGTTRWAIAQAPSDWSMDKIYNSIEIGGFDYVDVKKILSIEETHNVNGVMWRFDNE